RIAYDPTKGEIRMPSWSNQGNKLVHTRYSPEFISQEIFTMNTDGNNPTRLTNNTKDDRYPNYVFENNIVFWSKEYFWMMDSSGTNQRKISEQQIDYLFSIAPSGDRAVYTVYNNSWTYENGTLWILDLITGEKKQLTFNPKPAN